VNLDTLIFVLRIAATAILYLFMLGVVAVLWRDWRSVAQKAQRTREAQAQPLGHLIVVDSGETDLPPGQSFPLGVLTGLGRAPTNTIVIDDAFASSTHALISLRDGRWWVEDLDSRNGTRLNGERLNAPAIIATGDEIGIGSTRLRIELETV
jgi:pSer/pThr/pTyr-binding forkhead associated (FHA) protein